MAEPDTDTASFWLPSEFLTDDHHHHHHLAPSPQTSNRFLSLNSFPANGGRGFFDMVGGGGGGSSSALNSPGESATSSAEDNEADRDDFFDELTRHLSRTSLVERAAQELHHQHQDKPWGVLATSPQSTLSGFASWSSNRSNGAVPPVGRSSQPLPVLHALKNAKEEAAAAAMELIYAAAGQVARMKIRAAAEAQSQMLNGRHYNHHHHHQQQSRGLLGSPCNQPSSNLSTACSNFALGPSQFQQMNKERWESWFSLQRSTGNGCCGLHESAGNRNVFGGAHHQTPPTPAAWSSAAADRAQPHNHPHLHNHNHNHHNLNLRTTPPFSDCVVGVGGCESDGRNAVFLGGSGPVAPKKQSTGTGVFLPRRFPIKNNINSESRKKQGCPSPSTVLLPARVAHALNMKSNVDEPNKSGPHPQSRSCPQPCLVSNQVGDNIGGRRNAFWAQQKRTSRLEDAAAPPPTARHELLLPKDWTY